VNRRRLTGSNPRGGTRELTHEESNLLEGRRRGFEELVAERVSVLTDFAGALELPCPTMILNDPDSYLPAVDEFVRNQVVYEDDRVWIVTRLGYLIGEVLVQRLDGCWMPNDIPDTRYFARAVVGSFASATNSSAMADPFEAAIAFVAEPPGRSLSKLVAEVEDELRNA
jgi:hypothetical protein